MATKPKTKTPLIDSIGLTLARLYYRKERADASEVRRLAEGDKIMRVLCGIGEQCLTQGAFSPVCALMALLGMHAKLGFQDGAKPDLFTPQEPRGHHGVKQVGKAEAKIPFQADQVVFGGMEDLFDGGILEYICQRGEIRQRQWVDQGIHFSGGELDQADLLVVGIQAVRFSSHTQD